MGLYIAQWQMPQTWQFLMDFAFPFLRQPQLHIWLEYINYIVPLGGGFRGQLAAVTSGFADVARVAAEMYRPHLATVLLNHEPRSHAQVQVLVQLSREGDETLSFT